MIPINDTLVSDEVAEDFFLCDLNKCKGACCIEGDGGAPLEKEEIKILEDNYRKYRPYLTEAGIKAIRRKGYAEYDEDKDPATTLINGKECAYSFYDENKVLKCAIEKAWKEGRMDFPKPISCHLYPIRVSKFGETIGVNYHKWNICADACDAGQKASLPIYKFLKNPLIRKFGQEWYNELVNQIEKWDLEVPNSQNKTSEIKEKNKIINL